MSTAVGGLVMYRLVIKKRRQHEERREHKSGEVEANFLNSANAERFLMADKDSTEKFSHQNSRDLQFLPSDNLLIKASV